MVLLAKKQFPSDVGRLGRLLSEQLTLSEIFQNDIYSKVRPSVHVSSLASAAFIGKPPS